MEDQATEQVKKQIPKKSKPSLFRKLTKFFRPSKSSKNTGQPLVSSSAPISIVKSEQPKKPKRLKNKAAIVAEELQSILKTEENKIVESQKTPSDDEWCKQVAPSVEESGVLFIEGIEVTANPRVSSATIRDVNKVDIPPQSVDSWTNTMPKNSSDKLDSYEYEWYSESSEPNNDSELDATESCTDISRQMMLQMQTSSIILTDSDKCFEEHIETSEVVHAQTSLHNSVDPTDVSLQSKEQFPEAYHTDCTDKDLESLPTPNQNVNHKNHETHKRISEGKHPLHSNEENVMWLSPVYIDAVQHSYKSQDISTQYSDFNTTWLREAETQYSPHEYEDRTSVESQTQRRGITFKNVCSYRYDVETTDEEVSKTVTPLVPISHKAHSESDETLYPKSVSDTSCKSHHSSVYSIQSGVTVPVNSPEDDIQPDESSAPGNVNYYCSLDQDGQETDSPEPENDRNVRKPKVFKEEDNSKTLNLLQNAKLKLFTFLNKDKADVEVADHRDRINNEEIQDYEKKEFGLLDSVADVNTVNKETEEEYLTVEEKENHQKLDFNHCVSEPDESTNTISSNYESGENTLTSTIENQVTTNDFETVNKMANIIIEAYEKAFSGRCNRRDIQLEVILNKDLKTVGDHTENNTKNSVDENNKEAKNDEKPPEVKSEADPVELLEDSNGEKLETYKNAENDIRNLINDLLEESQVLKNIVLDNCFCEEDHLIIIEEVDSIDCLCRDIVYSAVDDAVNSLYIKDMEQETALCEKLNFEEKENDDFMKDEDTEITEIDISISLEKPSVNENSFVPRAFTFVEIEQADEKNENEIGDYSPKMKTKSESSLHCDDNCNKNICKMDEIRYSSSLTHINYCPKVKTNSDVTFSFSKEFCIDRIIKTFPTVTVRTYNKHSEFPRNDKTLTENVRNSLGLLTNLYKEICMSVSSPIDVHRNPALNDIRKYLNDSKPRMNIQSTEQAEQEKLENECFCTTITSQGFAAAKAKSDVSSVAAPCLDPQNEYHFSSDSMKSTSVPIVNFKDCRSFDIGVAQPKRRSASKRELNTASEIEAIDENLKQNDLLNPKTISDDFLSCSGSMSSSFDTNSSLISNSAFLTSSMQNSASDHLTEDSLIAVTDLDNCSETQRSCIDNGMNKDDVGSK